MSTIYKAENVTIDEYTSYSVEVSHGDNFKLVLSSSAVVDENVYQIFTKNVWEKVCETEPAFFGFRQIPNRITKTHDDCVPSMAIIHGDTTKTVVVAIEIGAHDFDTLLEALESAREVFWDLGLSGQPVFKAKENIKAAWKEQYYREYVEKQAWKLVRSSTVS